MLASRRGGRTEREGRRRVIGRLRGAVGAVQLDGTLIVDVGGVGYEVHVPLGTLGRAREGDEVELHVHTHARETELSLYGFPTAEDKHAFRVLLGVSNVGPKLALAILGSLDAQTLADAVARQDRAALKGISGVGKKTVERILLDLGGKLVAPPPGLRARAPEPRAVPLSGPKATVVGALVSMGYKRPEAERALESLEEKAGESVESLLRRALGAMG
ncbi:MAG: Holliday junction branch migration protein RuvA [Myxococcota bacterium]